MQAKFIGLLAIVGFVLYSNISTAYAGYLYGVHAGIGNLSISGPTSISYGPVSQVNDFPGGGAGMHYQIGDAFCDLACVEGYASAIPGVINVSTNRLIVPSSHGGMAQAEASFSDYIVIDSPGLTGTVGTLTSNWFIDGSVSNGRIFAQINLDGNSKVYSSDPFSPALGFTSVSNSFIFGEPINVFAYGISQTYYGWGSAYSSLDINWMGISSIASNGGLGVANYSVTSQSGADYALPILAIPDPEPIPEPSPLVLILFGIGLMSVGRLQKYRKLQSSGAGLQ